MESAGGGEFVALYCHQVWAYRYEDSSMKMECEDRFVGCEGSVRIKWEKMVCEDRAVMQLLCTAR